MLFSLIAGHLLEKRDKRLVTIPAHLIQGALALAVPAAWWLGILSVPLLAVIAFLSGTAALVFGIAGFAYVPQLVARDELPAANRAVQGSRTVTEIAGPGIAGALIGAVGPALAMIVDGIGFLTSAAGVAKGKPQHPPAPVDTEPDDATSIWTGMGILFGNTYLRSLTMHAALYNLAEAVFFLNLVLWAVQSQQLSEAGFGVALSAGGIGGLLATLTALSLSRRLGLGRAFAVSLVLSCGVPLLAAARPA